MRHTCSFFACGLALALAGLPARADGAFYVATNGSDANPGTEGNLRDHAPLEQLVVLTNLESLNAVLIRQGLPPSDRLLKLNEIAITQMRTLLSDPNVKRLK